MKQTIWKKIKMDSGTTYRIQANFGDLSLSLLILESNNQDIFAFKTPTILEQHLKKQANQLHISIEEYFKKLVQLFRNPDQLNVKITKNSFTILETLNSDLQVKYFNSDLKKVSDFASLIGNVIDDLNEQNEKSKGEYQDIYVKNESLVLEVGQLKQKLEELVERKRVDDEVMMGNFVSLLNEKKRRIQHLNELLEAFRTDPSLSNPAEVNVTYKRKRKRDIKEDREPISNIKEEISESDDSIYNDDTSRDGEINEDVEGRTSEQKTVASQYFDDIFDESPPSTKISVSTKMSCVNNATFIDESPVPSTSRGVVSNISKKNLKKNNVNVSIHSKASDMPFVEINTQDWLDGL